MPKRRKKAASRNSSKASMFVVPVDKELFATGSLSILGARAYDQDTLPLAFPEGDLSQVALMRITERKNLMNLDSFLCYFAYACGHLKDFSDIVLMKNDAEGQATRRLLESGATLLFDEEAVRSEDVPLLNTARFFEQAPIIPSDAFTFDLAAQNPAFGGRSGTYSLSFIGNLPANTGYALAYADISAELHQALKTFTANAGRAAQLTPMERTALVSHMPQLVIPASFGRFTDAEKRSIDRVLDVLDGERNVATELEAGFADGVLAREPSYAKAHSHLSRIRDTIAIWNRMMFKAMADEKTLASTRREAEAIIREGAELAEVTRSAFESLPSITHPAFTKVVAFGMAMGTDLVLDAYFAGASVESLFPDESPSRC